MYPGRTDATEIAKIRTIPAGSNTSLAIDMANDIVTEVCAPVLRADGVTPWHSEHRLLLIETLLAAHFTCLNAPQAERSRVGPLTFEAQTKVDLGFDVTVYGQQAKRLDTSGALAALDEAIEEGKIPGKFVCTLKHLGKRYSDWHTWEETVTNGSVAQ